jgi:hypothetical protein
MTKQSQIKLLNIVTSTINATLNPKPFKGGHFPICSSMKDNECFALNASTIVLHHQTLKIPYIVYNKRP